MASYLDSAIVVGIGVSLSTWAKTLGLDAWQLGMVSAVLTVCVGVGALFGGRIADLFGRRRVFTIDVAVYVVGVLLILFANGPAMLIAGVAVAGLAAGADLPTSIAVVAQAAPPGARGRLVAFTQVMWTLGIAVTTLLGFLTATWGPTGVTVLFGHLAVLGTVTWLFRVFHRGFRDLEADHSSDAASRAEVPSLRSLLVTPSYRTMILLTGGFYAVWILMANTFGQFKVYLLTEVSGATQSVATAVSFLGTLLALAFGVAFSFAADGPWRRKLFAVGAIGQIVAMGIGAVTGGTVLPAMIALLVLFNLTYPFAGEAIYKVWTQESFPTNARATVQGGTYAISRFLASGFALVTPALAQGNPSALLWLLVAFATGAALIGAVIGRRPGVQRATGPVAGAAPR